MSFLKIKRIITAFCALMCLLCILCSCQLDEYIFGETSEDYDYFPQADFFVHFIDVGQGDCALVQTNWGNVLIDAGTPNSVDDIIEYIDSLGITEFEYAIFTHPHSDHIGSAAELIDRYTFKNIMLPDAVSTTGYYEDLLDAIGNEACEVILGEAGKSFNIGGAVVDIFAPSSYYYADDLNNMSIIAKLTYGDVSFLFTGDAEKFSEKEIIEQGIDLSVDVLKVGHHGSNTSSCKEFLEATYPSVAIISAGKDNEYGHPHDEVVERLENIGTDMYITYEVGSILISTDGTSYSVSTEKYK